ncbi:MAG: hypothetical protein U0798_18725 [Gemmataceae bacterium]
MSERVDSDELLNGFRQVIAYRHITKQISKSANSTLVWGGVMMGIWILIFSQIGFQNWKRLPVYSYFYLGLAVGELTIGLWKKLFPSPAAFLVDALIVLGFAASNGWRAYDIYHRLGNIDMFSCFFAVFMAVQAYREFQAWITIQRLLVYRPTRAQLAQFDSFVRDVRRANPETEPNALDLKTRPEFRALLLGDIAFFVASSGEVIVAHRDEVHIGTEQPSSMAMPGQPKSAMLFLEGGQFGPFPLDERSEANYLAWKTSQV